MARSLNCFADDTNLFISGIDFVELERKANACLLKMETWFIVNKLSLNIEKICYTIFSSNKRTNTSFTLFVYK